MNIRSIPIILVAAATPAGPDADVQEASLRAKVYENIAELKPICQQEDEECWGQNRRAETMIGTAEAR